MIFSFSNNPIDKIWVDILNKYENGHKRNGNLKSSMLNVEYAARNYIVTKCNIHLNSAAGDI